MGDGDYIGTIAGLGALAITAGIATKMVTSMNKTYKPKPLSKITVPKKIKWI